MAMQSVAAAALNAGPHLKQPIEAVRIEYASGNWHRRFVMDVPLADRGLRLLTTRIGPSRRPALCADGNQRRRTQITTDCPGAQAT
jgi:hypothetical protein